eukprot:gene22875-29629_t
MLILEIIFTLFSAIGACFSLAVVLTGLLWPRFMLSRHRPFSKMIFFISCCDLLGSSANCIGFPKSGSIPCSIQAFFYLYFIPASWLWTTMFVYQLRNLLILKRIRVTMAQVHAVCWGIPLITSLLPLTTNPYGQDDFIDGTVPCVLGGDRITRLLWISTTDSGLSFMLVILMTIWLVQIHRYLSSVESSDSTVKEKALFASMKQYPLALFITWVPRFIESVVRGAEPLGGDPQVAIIPTAILASQYGVIVAVIFFHESATARLLWYNMFKRLAYQYCSNKSGNSSGDSSLTASIRETNLSHVSLFDDTFIEDTPEDMLVVECTNTNTNSRSDGNISGSNHDRTGKSNSSDYDDPPAEVSIIMEMTRSSAMVPQNLN